MGITDNPRFVGKPASVVEAAFRSWVKTATMTTGLASFNDRDRLIETLRRLRVANYQINPDELHGWLTSGGYSTKYADEITNEVKRFNSGVNLRQKNPGPFWKDNIVDQWRKEVEGNTEES